MCGIWRGGYPMWGCVVSCGVGEVVECCVSRVFLFTSIVPDMITS